MMPDPSANNAILVMAVEGRLDAATAAAYTARIKILTESGPVRCVLDLENLRYLNSAGLSVLTSALHLAVQAGGDMKIARLTPEMKALFALTRLNTVFEIHESVETAVAAYGQDPACHLPRLVLPLEPGEQPAPGEFGLCPAAA